jgi:hypothetical protein
MPMATDEMKQFALHCRDLTHIRKIYDTDDQAEKCGYG